MSLKKNFCPHIDPNPNRILFKFYFAVIVINLSKPRENNMSVQIYQINLQLNFSFVQCKRILVINPLSIKPTKLSNTLQQAFADELFECV